MHFRSKFGDSSLNGWWVMVQTSSKWGEIWLSSWIWPWRSWSIIPKNNRDLNQCVLHLWSKFGDPSLNEWWVIVRTNSWLIDTHTDTQTHRRSRWQNRKAKTCDPLKSPVLYLSFQQKFLNIKYVSLTLKPWDYFTILTTICKLKTGVNFADCNSDRTMSDFVSSTVSANGLSP